MVDLLKKNAKPLKILRWLTFQDGGTYNLSDFIFTMALDRQLIFTPEIVLMEDLDEITFG